MKRKLMKKMLIARNLTQREMFRLTGATVAIALMGSNLGQSGSKEPTSVSTQRPTGTTTAATPSCVVRPQQTKGPYFVDEQLNRSDIRVEPSDGSVKGGVPVGLVFKVSRTDDSSCTPLSGAVVDVWQCDAMGIYSGVQDINGLFDIRGKKFLRGYQIADASGTAQFITIYPGWYPARPSTSTSKFALIRLPNGVLSLRRSCTSMMPSQAKFMRRRHTPPRDRAH
jgi:protocatechuate 3,4-dioxygenase beta subunit